ncbi:MAG: hypothetical protein WCC06_11315 [Candidatus Aminicenantales bacterium]
MNSQSRDRENLFIPRIINPLRVKQVIIFAADAQVRKAKTILEESLPWLRTEIIYDPQSVMHYASPEATVFLLDDTSLAFLDAERIRIQNKNVIMVLLSYQEFIQCSPPQAAKQKYPYTAKADLVFAVNQNTFAPQKILVSAVRAAEDLLNIEKYSRARRFIFHVVDDEPRWFSQFLPVLYDIVGQRVDVRITRTYEESLQFLFGVEEESQVRKKNFITQGHGDDVVCLITDIFFPKKNKLQSDAGRDLIRLVNKYYPRIPVIIASKAEEAREFSDLGFILPKGDPGSLQKLKDYILNFTGLGDFLIYDKEGQELHRAKDIYGICQILTEAEKDTRKGRQLREIFESYGEKDKFSTWLYMHSYAELGDRLRPRRSQGQHFIIMLKRHFQSEIARIEQIPLVVDGQKIFSLSDLHASIKTLDPDIIQPYSDNDIISSWLDRKGYSELAEELRPIHGSGAKLSQTLLQIIDKWIKVYEERVRTL